MKVQCCNDFRCSESCFHSSSDSPASQHSNPLRLLDHSVISTPRHHFYSSDRSLGSLFAFSRSMRLMDEFSESQPGRLQSFPDRTGARSSQTGAGAGCAGAFFNMFDWHSSKRNAAAGRPNSEAVYARRDSLSFSERTCNTTSTLPLPTPTNEGKNEAFSTVKSTPTLSCAPSPASMKSDDTSKRVPGVVARLMGLESLPDGIDSSLSESQYAHSTAGSEHLESPPLLLQELLRQEFQDPENPLQEKLQEFPQSPLLSPSMLGGMNCLLDDALKSLELTMQPFPRSQGCLTGDSPNENGASFRSERKITTPSHGRAGSLSYSSTKSPGSISTSKPWHRGQFLAETRAAIESRSSRKSGIQDEANRRHFEMALAASTKSRSPNRERASSSKRVESSPRALSSTDGRKQDKTRQGNDKGEALTMKRTNSPSKRSPFQKLNPAPAPSPPSTSQCNVSQIRKPWRKVNAEESVESGITKASQRESSPVSSGSTERKFGLGLSKPPVAALPPLSPDFSSFDTALLDASLITSSEVFGSCPTFPYSPLVNYEKCFFFSRNHLNLQEMVEVVSGNQSDVLGRRRSLRSLSEPHERVLTSLNDQDAAAQLDTCSNSAVCEIQRTSVDPEDVMMMTPPASKKLEEKLAHDHLYPDVSCVERCRQPSPVSVLENPFLDEGPTTPDASLTDKQEQDIGGKWNRVSSSSKHSVVKQASPLLESEDLKASGFSYGISTGDNSDETDKGMEALIMKHTDSAFMRSLLRPAVATNSFSQWNVKAFPDLSKAIKAVEEQFSGFDSQSGSASVDYLPIEQMFGGRGFSKSNVAALSTTPDFSCFDKLALETSPLSSEAYVTDCRSGPGTFPSSPLIMYEEMF